MRRHSAAGRFGSRSHGGCSGNGRPGVDFRSRGSPHRHEAAVGEVCLCEVAEKFFRRFDLPEQIDVDNVSAKLDKGILQIVALKAQAVKSRQPTQAAA